VLGNFQITFPTQETDRQHKPMIPLANRKGIFGYKFGALDKSLLLRIQFPATGMRLLKTSEFLATKATPVCPLLAFRQPWRNQVQSRSRRALKHNLLFS